MDINKLKTLRGTATENGWFGGHEGVTDPETGVVRYKTDLGDGFTYLDEFQILDGGSTLGRETLLDNGVVVWQMIYKGGIVNLPSELHVACYDFLKTVIIEHKGEHTRGPENYAKGDWRYEYVQKGQWESFTATERIFYNEELAFVHHFQGGTFVEA